jgi:hypothetical protein
MRINQNPSKTGWKLSQDALDNIRNSRKRHSEETRMYKDW